MKNRQWVLVAGATGGIGKAIVARLIEAGYAVLAVGRNTNTLAEMKNVYTELSNDCFKELQWDLSEIDSFDALVNHVFEKVGPIHGLVYAAGREFTCPLAMTKTKNLIDIFTVNTFAFIMLTAKFGRKKYMCPSGASIVGISSIAPREGARGNSVYAASKGAMDGFLKAAASELSAIPVRLNLVAPGFVSTKMTENFFSRLSREQVSAIESSYPFGFGNPVEVAEMVEFLVSEKSNWTTGQTFILDGGHLAFVTK